MPHKHTHGNVVIIMITSSIPLLEGKFITGGVSLTAYFSASVIYVASRQAKRKTKPVSALYFTHSFKLRCNARLFISVFFTFFSLIVAQVYTTCLKS